MTEFEVINRFVDVDGTNKIIRGVWSTTNFFVDYFFLSVGGQGQIGSQNFAHKIIPLTEFEVINRVVDVDSTKKERMIIGVWLTTFFLIIYFALLGVENL